MSTSTLPAHPENDIAVRRQQSLGVLAAFLLSDAITDVEVVSRELSSSPVMLERMRRASDSLQCVGRILEAEVTGRLTGRSDGDPHAFKQIQEYLDGWPNDGLEMSVADFLESNRDASQCGGNVAADVDLTEDAV
jgi:hypothetical protein